MISSLDKETARHIDFAIVAALGISFILFASENHLLGDGYNVLGNISGGLIFSPAEPLAYLLHHFIAAIFGDGEAAAEIAYRISSVIAGLGFLAGLYYFAKEKSEFLLLVTVALCFAPVQFFFGYIENYTFSFTFSCLYLLSALADIDRKKLSAATLLWLLLAILFHFSAGVFVPSYIYLIFKENRSRIIAYLLLIATVAVSFAALAIILRYFDILNIFLPLTPTPDRSYSFFSAVHFKDLLNTMLLSSPLIIALPFVYRMLNRRKRIFMLFAFVFSFLFTIGIDPTLGAYRDWDLLAIFSVPVLVFFIGVINASQNTGRISLYSSLIPLLLFSVIHTGSWIWLNSDKADCYEYAKRVVQSDPHYSLGYQSGFRNKSWGYIAKNKMRDPEEAVRAWEIRYHGESHDYLNIQYLIRAYGVTEDTLRAVELIRKEWRRFVTEDTTISLMVTFLSKAGMYDDAEEIYEYLVATNRADYKVYNDLAMIKMLIGKADSSVILFDKSFRLWPNPPLDLEIKFYIACHHSGYRDMAVNGFNRMKNRFGEDGKDHFDDLLHALDYNDEMAVKQILQQILSRK